MSRPFLVILAGGKGTRLGDLTRDIPKPMVDIFGKPFLYWLIKHYVKQGFTDIVVSTGYRAEAIEKYPWPWALSFECDSDYLLPYTEYYNHSLYLVVNGDTWIEDPLPKEEGPWITSSYGVDAGAQRPGLGKIKVFEREFWDIGTPKGLENFKRYFKTHPYYLTHIDKK